MENITIRNATLKDAKGILDVFRPYIEQSIFTFQTEVPSIEVFQLTMQRTMKDLPYLVAERNNEILGFAYASYFQENRQAYQYTCILSIYVKESTKGSGLAHQLYEQIEEKLIEHNIVQVYSNVTASNIASRRFHEKKGFKQVGQMPHFGYKFDEWHDIVWLAKTIQTPQSI